MSQRASLLFRGLLTSIATLPLLAAACASPDTDGAGGSADAEGPEAVAEAGQAIAITKIIPIRFIEALDCKPGTLGCNSNTSYAILRDSVDRANEIYADQGIKFWIKSIERYFLPKFAHKDDTAFFWADVKNGASGTTEDGLRSVFPAMTSGSYSDYLDAKSWKGWLNSTTSFFGDPDELAVWITDDGTDGGQSEGWYPEHGRMVLSVAHNLGDPANGWATTSLAHEMGHFFGVRHPWSGPAGRNPATGANWTDADHWDLVYCAQNQFYFTKFFQSEYDFDTWNCPASRVKRILTQSNCDSSDPFGEITCTIDGDTYVSGDPNIDHLFFVDSSVPQNPPSSIQFGVNVMDYYGNSGHDLRAPARFTSSQLYEIQQYKTYDMLFDASDITAVLRSDGQIPTNGNSSGFASLRPQLGTAAEDFIWWGNGGDMSFKSQTKPISGTNYTPVSGDFDNNGYDDVLWYNPASGGAYIWYSLGNKVWDSSPLLNLGAGYGVVAGNFDGLSGDDIFLYHSGWDKMYWSNGTQTLPAPSNAFNVADGMVPAVGNFDNQGGDDMVWYGGSFAQFWWAVGTTKTFTVQYNVLVGSGYQPIAGNFDGAGGADLFWYGPGAVAESIWYSQGDKTFDKRASGVSGTYTPIAGDFDGDGGDDIFWDSENHTTDFIWKSLKNRNAPFQSIDTSVYGAFRPVAGKFDGTWQGKNTTDIFWYRKP